MLATVSRRDESLQYPLRNQIVRSARLRRSSRIREHVHRGDPVVVLIRCDVQRRYQRLYVLDIERSLRANAILSKIFVQRCP